MTLNRRGFIGAMVASASLTQLGIPVASAMSVSSARQEGGQQGAWLRRGMIDAGGTHEPYIFIVRRATENEQPVHVV
ncbi:MAG: hypothetical protein ACYCRE_11315 [Acidobacteriaceae bacterium]